MLLSTSLFAQKKLPFDTLTNKVVFRTIIQLNTTYKADQIFSIVKEWFSTNTKNFNRSNSDKNANGGNVLLGIQKGNSTQLDQLYNNTQPLKFQDAIEKKLIGKGVYKFTGGSFGCIRVLFIEYDIKVFVKDSKLKVEITNLNYTHYNQVSMAQTQIYGFNDTGDCTSKNTIENLIKCNHCADDLEYLYSYLNYDMSILTTNLKTFLKDNKKASSSDGW